MIHCFALRISRLVLAIPLLVLPAAGTALSPDRSAAAEAPRWLGADLQPLPFSSDEELLDFLRQARIVASKRLDSGINRPYKLTLERDGIRAHAAFRSVDRNPPRAVQRRPDRHRERDSYIFEVAAYEIARLLGLDQVPPVVLRSFDGRRGSLQLWIEEAATEAMRIEAAQPPPNPASWHLQRQLMTVFDNLIYNTDRNHGNMLLDADGKLWFIDHTRAFKQLPALIEQITLCERSFFVQLKGLDPKEIKRRLSPYLESSEVMALLARRKQLIKRIERLIAERGEEMVLFSLESTAESSS